MSNELACFFMGWSLGGLFFYIVGKKSGKADGLCLANKILSGSAPAASKPEAAAKGDEK